VRTTTPKEARRVARYVAKPILALGCLAFDEDEGKAIYRYGKSCGECEVMDCLDFIARVTAHIPEKGQVMVRCCGLYLNAHRGKERDNLRCPLAIRLITTGTPSHNITL